MKHSILFFLLIIALGGCAKEETTLSVIQEPLEEIYDSKEVAKESGSLWNQSNGSMFTDHKAQQIGDIVTVLISESSSASKAATTSTSRETNMSAAISNFFGLENDDVWEGYNPVDLSNLVNADFANGFDGSGSTSRTEDLTASLTTQVVGRYPNGQLKIRGGKEVMVNSEVQMIYLTGIIRPVDITAANTVSSTKILNARISYTGKGSISDKQSPGWAMRFLDNVWPF
ncbi:flagellar basal body L-ring protein FlgH [Desulforhopalus sp. IMCC35007]|uniref:flagellar basal body L-ring protein FlgH n=1 Tax=Desulforhopalus sp. IMCC35007 TaxID=2569543 RepID=UPI0010ADC2DA|nr:flagellar basal body L-ring protein FlgH [Desulforhopalus sp. IMCC35007]TKB10270.1 flagellar basal body L-ring protein FlgH [Desulforhopalus sp. IMCC35007]